MMKIGIVGTGHIGKILVQRLSAAGHQIKFDNSRGPETIESEILSDGAQAFSAAEVVKDVETLILSIPLNRIPDIVPLLASVPDDTVVIDTSNYYPARDNKIEDIEAGKVESVWVSEQLGRPIAKAWNAIGSDSLANKGEPAGSPNRIAIPVAADREHDREVAMRLVEETGLDAVYSGSIADSWRQQPGAPAYGTDLTRDEIPGALAAADKARLPKRRDLAVEAFLERMGDPKTNPDADFGVRVSRALYM